MVRGLGFRVWGSAFQSLRVQGFRGLGFKDLGQTRKKMLHGHLEDSSTLRNRQFRTYRCPSHEVVETTWRDSKVTWKPLIVNASARPPRLAGLPTVGTCNYRYTGI